MLLKLWLQMAANAKLQWEHYVRIVFYKQRRQTLWNQCFRYFTLIWLQLFFSRSAVLSLTNSPKKMWKVHSFALFQKCDQPSLTQKETNDFMPEQYKVTHSVYVLRGYCLRSVGSGEEDAHPSQCYILPVCHKHFRFLAAIRLLGNNLSGHRGCCCWNKELDIGHEDNTRYHHNQFWLLTVALILNLLFQLQYISAMIAITDIKYYKYKTLISCYTSRYSLCLSSFNFYMVHVTCFDQLSVLIVEHEVWETLSHKELLHAVNLRQIKNKTFFLQLDTTLFQTERHYVVAA